MSIRVFSDAIERPTTGVDAGFVRVRIADASGNMWWIDHDGSNVLHLANELDDLVGQSQAKKDKRAKDDQVAELLKRVEALEKKQKP